jgi:hypothetical protein
MKKVQVHNMYLGVSSMSAYSRGDFKGYKKFKEAQITTRLDHCD